MDNKTIDYKAGRTYAKAELREILSDKNIRNDSVTQWAVFFYLKARYDVYDGEVYQRSLDFFDVRKMPCCPCYRVDSVIEKFVMFRQWEKQWEMETFGKVLTDNCEYENVEQARPEFEDLLSVKGVDKDPVKQWAIYIFIKAKYDVYDGEVYKRSLDSFDTRNMPSFPCYRVDQVIEMFVKLREWDRKGKELQNAKEESRHS